MIFRLPQAYRSLGVSITLLAMELPKSEALANRLVWVAETGSTNSDLISAASKASLEPLPDFTVYVAGFQNAGRGRSGRAWLAPAGSSLFVSVLLRPNASIETFSWLPLLAGLAMSRAVRSRLATNHELGVKWPNDVLVDGKKVCGVLSELLPDLSGVVVGAGLNLTLSPDQLPVETATSLGLLGDPDAERSLGGAIEAGALDEILAAYLGELRSLLVDFNQHRGNAALAGLMGQVIAGCVTLGQQVRVIMPGDQELWGLAKSIDEQGRLVVEKPDSKTVAVSAGDIVHLRLQ